MTKYIFKNVENKKTARVDYTDLAITDKKWMVELWCFGMIDYEAKGTHGLGIRCYATEEQAIRAAKYYVSKGN